jgi:4-hydroxythreonine-4-phosphate dehydrogenase
VAERKPRLVVSSGDPAGIGPEVTIKALAQPEVTELADATVTGDPALLARTARDLDLPVPEIEPAGDAAGVEPGRLSAAAGRAAVAAIERAVALIQSGKADALVTAPINKEALRLAGFSWPGHTELLAELTGSKDVRMLLTAGNLRVVHVTTHRSLRSAIEAVKRERVLRTIELTAAAGASLGIERPRVGVAGLNPHAGEGGLFGDEEEREIRPAVDEARSQGIDVTGPWPADTLFWRAANGAFDLVIAMYHDQGHVPVKLSGFDEGVNVTLGLPIVRTSVDHGTAFDIAGKGVARWQSMAAAIRMAAVIADHVSQR